MIKNILQTNEQHKTKNAVDKLNEANLMEEVNNELDRLGQGGYWVW